MQSPANLGLAVALVAVTALAGCADDGATPADAQWLSIVPKQCEGNPWQGDEGQVAPEDEEGQLREHYAIRDVAILEFQRVAHDGPVVALCGAARGETIWVSVASDREASVLDADGWQAGDGPGTV